MAIEVSSTSTSEDTESRILYLNDDVDAGSMKPIIEQILKWNEQDDEKDKKQKDFVRKPVKLIVNTYGGSVYDGFGLISVIDNSKTPIHTYVYGKAMSMGFLIAAAGHKRFAGKLATFMYHQIASFAWGKLEQIKEDVKECERLQAMYNGYLLARTAIRESDVQPVLDRRGEWFFGADEAVKLKLVDEVL